MSKYRIITFDGNGIRGLLSVGFLKRLNSELGDDSWITKADMFAGTSTGGLIALALADGKSVEEIESLYVNDGREIFNKCSLNYISSLWRLLHAGYRNDALSRVLHTMFDDKQLNQLNKKVLIPSFDLRNRDGKRKYWAPKIFQNFESFGQDTRRIRDIALYTSAAPTYLPAVDGFIDGGVFANNPSMCALAQVLDTRNVVRQKIEDVHIISIGTGINPESIKKRSMRWGILGWNMKVMRIIMDGTVGIADFQCSQILTDTRYMRVQLELDRCMDMDDAKMIPEMQRTTEQIDSALIKKWADWIRANWY